MDLKSLCISEGEAAWLVRTTVTFLSVDGGLLDTAVAAAVAVMASAYLPQPVMDEDGVVAIADESGTARAAL